MTSAALLAFAAVLAVAVASPGPGILAVISCALSRGFVSALALIAGIVAGDALILTLAALGLALMAKAMGGFFLIVKLAGAAYLVWLGVKAWRSLPHALSLPPSQGVADHGRTALTGLAVTLGNPKSLGFYLGIMPMVVHLELLTHADLLAMIAVDVVVVGGICIVYAAAAAKARGFLGTPKRLRAVNRTAGAAMIGAGVAIAVR